MQHKRRGRKAKTRTAAAEPAKSLADKRRPRQLAPKEKRERLKPISLHPLDFDEAIRRLLPHPGRK